MRVALLTNRIGVLGGGVGEAVRGLALGLAGLKDCTVVVASTDAVTAAGSLAGRPGIELFEFSLLGPRRLGWAPGLTDELLGLDLDLIHLHGLWPTWTMTVRQWSRVRRGGPYVVSPHGMLDPWALGRSRWTKRLAGWLYANRLLEEAQILHSLCASETSAILSFTQTTRVEEIPNGVSLPGDFRRDVAGFGVGDERSTDARRCALFLGRLDPKKNVLALLSAWRAASVRDPSLERRWRLCVVGWGPDGYVSELRRYIGAHGLGSSVYLRGPAFGEARTAAYREADLFVLPSLSEGLPMAVLEAWSFGVPALMSAQCNLEFGFAHGAAFPCGTDPESLESALLVATALGKNELAGAGERARALVEETFNWPAVASAMRKLYQDALGRWQGNSR